MKQKCEEIIIDRYLKGNITDKNKNRHLEGLAMLNQDGLKYVYNKLTNNSLQFFEETQMFFETWDQFSETEQKEVFSQAVSDNEVLKLFKEIEELEDELSKQH
jgi:replicative superfamily II helicase